MIQLQKIQKELKAPKDQYNDFGKYRYRSAESILEAVKPLLYNYDVTLTLSDDIVEAGGNVYVKATATITNKDKETVSVTAFAREADTKKGMDASQITGTASSYARKYALNGLFLIDDTKDADTNAYHQQTTEAPAEHEQFVDKIISTKNAKDIKTLLQQTNSNVPAFLEYYNVKSVEEMTVTQYADAVKRLSKKEKSVGTIEVK